jgi:hypothetical protein
MPFYRLPGQERDEESEDTCLVVATVDNPFPDDRRSPIKRRPNSSPPSRPQTYTDALAVFPGDSDVLTHRPGACLRNRVTSFREAEFDRFDERLGFGHL